MAYFDEGMIRFLRNLKKNNDREWFAKNKNTYEVKVKDPLEKLVADLILKFQKIIPGFQLEVKDSVFRIHRDVRFSNDKSPYKTSASAVIAPGGRKNMSQPGLYIHFEPGQHMIVGGLHMPDKDLVSKIRTAILNHPAEVKKLNADKKFIEYFGRVQGETNKIVPPLFKEAAKKEPLLANKEFIYVANFKDDLFPLREDLLEFILQHYKAGQGWTNFISEAIK